MSESTSTETSNKRTLDQTEISTEDAPLAKKQQLEQTPAESAPIEVVIKATEATDDLEEAMMAEAEAGSSKPSVDKKGKGKNNKKKSTGREYKGTHDRGVWERRPDREYADGEEKEARLPKKKVALLLGFSGSGYNGMQ